MKSKLIEDQETVTLPLDDDRVKEKQIKRNGVTTTILVVTAGSILQDDGAMLVRMGVAIPADDECRKFVNLSDEQLNDLQQRYKLTESGILPEDREDFINGDMEGYIDNEAITTEEGDELNETYIP